MKRHHRFALSLPSSPKARLALLPILAMLQLTPVKAASLDENICDRLLNNLVPLEISRGRYPVSEPVPPGEIRFLGHDFTYTPFEIPPQDPQNNFPFVIFSGDFHLRDGDGQRIIKKVDAAISSRGHFIGALWFYHRTTDLPEYGNLDGVRLVNSVLLFLKNGADYDDRLRALPERRMSAEIYDCQSCEDLPSFARGVSQDLTTVRLAILDNHTYVITTAPLVVVAELQPPHKAARYFLCPREIGRGIQVDTDRVHNEAEKIKPALKEPG